jgi:hypothetical protein
VRRVLRMVQGHPKLMELADAAAAEPMRLDLQLAAAEAVAEPVAGTVGGLTTVSGASGAADVGSGLDAFWARTGGGPNEVPC